MTGEPRAAARTALVTGAAGFIGSALCARLVAAGHLVVGYDNLSRGRRELLPPPIRFVQGDIRDRAQVMDAFATTAPDWVIHLAAMHFIPDCIARPHETLAVNVDGTRNVLEACRGTSVRNVVFASTAAVYKPTDEPCAEDTTPAGPLEIYGESKLAGEELLRTFHRESGVSTAILRLFNGVGRHETNPHVIPHIFESLRTSDSIELGNLTAQRDYIDTRDLAAAIVSVLDLTGIHTLNVGTGIARSVEQIIESLRRMLDRPIAVVRDPGRVRGTDRMVLVANIGRIRGVTGWAPRIAWEETLADLIDAYRLTRSRQGRPRSPSQIPPTSAPNA